MSVRSHIIVYVSTAIAIGTFNKRANERPDKFCQEEMYKYSGLSALKKKFPKPYVERAKREVWPDVKRPPTLP